MSWKRTGSANRRFREPATWTRGAHLQYEIIPTQEGVRAQRKNVREEMIFQMRRGNRAEILCLSDGFIERASSLSALFAWLSRFHRSSASGGGPHTIKAWQHHPSPSLSLSLSLSVCLSVSPLTAVKQERCSTATLLVLLSSSEERTDAAAEHFPIARCRGLHAMTRCAVADPVLRHEDSVEEHRGKAQAKFDGVTAHRRPVRRAARI